jgi:phage baseplate assembly protein gpV
MPDFFERIPDQSEVLRQAVVSHQTEVWTAQPGVLTKVSDLAGKITVDVQPVVQGKVRTPDGVTTLVNLPVIPDVPVVFPRGGGYVLTFPVAVGDEVLIVHAARNIDGWWQQGGIQPPFDSRMHDITDAFVVPGPYSQKTKFSGLSATTAQWRSEDGTIFAELDHMNKKIRLISNGILVELDSNNKVVNINGMDIDNINVNANTKLTITCPLTQINGDLHVTGVVTAGFGGGDQVGVQSHTHTQGNDGHGDGEVPTNPPTAGS